MQLSPWEAGQSLSYWQPDWLLYCCWSSPAEWFLIQIPKGLMTILCCLAALGAFKTLPLAKILKNVPKFYRTWRSITVFTTARHWSPSWARLFSHLCLGCPSGLFSSGFPAQNSSRIPLRPMYAICPANLILLVLLILIIFIIIYKYNNCNDIQFYVLYLYLLA
jgi:hypothetical protein